MKKVIYALILLLVVVSGLVFANREIKNETSRKPDPKTEKAELQRSFLNLQMADKPGRTSAKGCRKICGKMVSGEIASLQMIKGCF